MDYAFLPGVHCRPEKTRELALRYAVDCREPALVLSRARLKATILLPVGSEPGEYEVQILDADLKSRASSTGNAAIIDYVTTLETTLDTSALPSGPAECAQRS